MAYDLEAPASKKVIAELTKDGVRRTLMKVAQWSTGSPTSAEDLVHDAVVEVLDGERSPWVHPKWSFLTHMTFVMRHVWDQRKRLVASQREILASEAGIGERTPSNEPFPDEQAHRNRRLETYRELGRQLRADLEASGHPTALIARQVFDAACDGIDEAADQAALIGCTVEQIYRARELLKEHGQRIRHEWQVSESRRMGSLRDALVSSARAPATTREES